MALYDVKFAPVAGSRTPFSSRPLLTVPKQVLSAVEAGEARSDAAIARKMRAATDRVTAPETLRKFMSKPHVFRSHDSAP